MPEDLLFGPAHVARFGNDASLVPLFRQLHDSVDLFRDLALRSRVPMNQQYARRQMFQRQAFLRNLKPDLDQSDSEPADGTLAGHWRNFRKDIQSFLPDAERNMLATVNEGENALSAAYLRALDDGSHTQDVHSKLEHQREQVLHSQAELHDLKNRR